MERGESEMDDHGCGDGAMLCLELDVGKRGQDCYCANGYEAKRRETSWSEAWFIGATVILRACARSLTADIGK
jgi:hypothetical protein